MHTHTHYYAIKAIMLGAYRGWVLGLWVVIGWSPCVAFLSFTYKKKK